ncbi:MAG: tellurite resistance TerB family protein [Leptolyngbyaceae cyanobacterium MO_188.B28]|nr:tellurite resistance TerB family protein [Leptolyngbyaceae cyanobacterium MO_188.B28]
MGLFDGIFNAEKGITEVTLSPAESIAAICLVAIASDGYLSDQEGKEMTMLLSRMQLFRSYSNDVMQRLMDKLMSLLKQQGPNSLITLAKTSLPHELRQTAFALATDLVLVDGAVTSQEQAFLDDLYRILEIPGDTALQIVQVMTIKNRG